jgi:hypothetical protein
MAQVNEELLKKIHFTCEVRHGEIFQTLITVEARYDGIYREYKCGMSEQPCEEEIELVKQEAKFILTQSIEQAFKLRERYLNGDTMTDNEMYQLKYIMK